MNNFTLRSIFNSSFLLFAFTLLFSFETLAQTDNIKEADSSQIIKNSYRINEIPEETERLSQRIIALREILKPSTKISKIDSLLKTTSIEIRSKVDTLYSLLGDISRRDLKVHKVEWINYRTHLKDYQNILKDRTENITEINEELIQEIEKWELTKKKLTDVSDSNNIYNGLDGVILTLNDVIETVHIRLDSVFIVQKGITELVLIVDGTLSEIESVELQMQKDYFVIDSRPLWLSKKVDSSKTDSITIQKASALILISEGFEKNKIQVNEFISLNTKSFVLQIVFILVLIILMFRVNKKWNKNRDVSSNPVERQTKIILSHPISSSIISGVLISSYFYDALIPAYGELSALLVFTGMIFLLPKLTNKRFIYFLLLLLFAYLIQTIQPYIVSKVELVRWLIILDAIAMITSFIVAKGIMKKSPTDFIPIQRIFKVIFPIYIILLGFSILVNVIGMVSLSKLLVSGIIMSTILGLIVYITVKVIVTFFILIFKLKRTSNIQTFSTMIDATNRRFQPILIWIGFIVWIMFTLKGFDLFNFINTWIGEIMITEWDIGEMTISVGGILAFIGILIITLVLTKIISSIFLDDWMNKLLPRGAGPAISLTLRIIVVSFGLYIALSAAGLDLSRLGFIMGALGVGIGFGLQNIVLNFISGLILAFERPINIGDTIEVDQEFGVVTNIGVRSSNIKSYSGYESIIPNGDLISKKVNNYTLANRDRRSKILMKTAPNADPEKVIELFNNVAFNHPNVFDDPAPKTYFYGYDLDGSLSFALLYWSTFSDTLKTDSAIALEIFIKLKEAGIQAPAPVRRIVEDKK